MVGATGALVQPASNRASHVHLQHFCSDYVIFCAQLLSRGVAYRNRRTWAAIATEVIMGTAYAIGGIVAALLLAYLVYALIKAEDF